MIPQEMTRQIGCFLELLGVVFTVATIVLVTEDVEGARGQDISI